MLDFGAPKLDDDGEYPQEVYHVRTGTKFTVVCCIAVFALFLICVA